MVTVVVVVVCEWLLLCVRERTFFNDFHFKCNSQKVHFQFSKHAPYIYFIMKIAKCQVLGVSLKGGETKFFSKYINLLVDHLSSVDPCSDWNHCVCYWLKFRQALLPV